MFLGTPRGHKGVDDLVDAVGVAGCATCRLVAGRCRCGRRVGAPPLGVARTPGATGRRDSVRRRAALSRGRRRGRRAAAGHEDTVGQVPAKIFDAMALARPIVSTAVSMIPEILDGCGVLVVPAMSLALAGALSACSTTPRARPWAARAGAAPRALQLYRRPRGAVPATRETTRTPMMRERRPGRADRLAMNITVRSRLAPNSARELRRGLADHSATDIVVRSRLAPVSARELRPGARRPRSDGYRRAEPARTCLRP